MNTHLVIFSKDRTLQLKSLLLSLRHFSDLPEENITVIYVESQGITYEPLIKEFKCKFLRQTVFLTDLINDISNSGAAYTGFMVDDLIFRDTVSFKDMEKLLDNDISLDAFCFRMGRNIHCGKQPEFKSNPPFIEWETSPTLGRHWNYFWEVSSSFFRTEFVMKYLSKCRTHKERFPNPFEYHFYACMPNSRSSGLAGIYLKLRYPFARKKHKIASYEYSKCFTQGVNLVADLGVERAESFDIKTLHAKMMEGYIADFKNLKDALPESPNAGNKFFKLVKEI